MDWAQEVLNYGLIGLRTTIILSVVGLFTSATLGFVIGLGAYLYPALRIPINIYTQLWRGLPMLVTLFVVFFVLPMMNILVDGNTAVLIALTLWGSANVGEVVFGALHAMPPSQTQAARALGFKTSGVILHVLLPQAIRRMAPPLVNILSNLIQATSLASAVGAVDLLEAVNRASSNLTFNYGDPHSFVVFGTVMMIYFLMCYPLSFLSKQLERRNFSN